MWIGLKIIKNPLYSNVRVVINLYNSISHQAIHQVLVLRWRQTWHGSWGLKHIRQKLHILKITLNVPPPSADLPTICSEVLKEVLGAATWSGPWNDDSCGIF